MSQARNPGENFLAQSVSDCCGTSGGNDHYERICFCFGTRIRATIGEPYRVQSMVLAMHFEWSRRAFTPIETLVVRSSWVEDCRKGTRERAAPDRIAGRGGKERTGEGLKFAPLRWYSRPTSGNREEVRTQNAASFEVMKWVGSMMREWPHEVLPVVGCDASTWIGRRSDGQKQWRGSSDPYIELSRQVRETCC